MEIKYLINILEGDQELLNHRIGKFLIWPSVRFIVLQHLIDKANNLNAPREIGSKESILSKIKGLLSAIINCPFFGPKKKMLVFSSATSNIKLENGNYFNRITDYFYEIDSPYIWKIEESIGFSKALPQTYKGYSKLSLTLFIEVLLRLHYVFANRKVKMEIKQFNTFVKMLNIKLKPLGLEIDSDQLISCLRKIVLKIEPTYYTYKTLFKIKKIQKILIEDGYYGVEKASIIKAAKDCGIYVLEPQHGFINEKHPCYNFGIGIKSSENFKSYLPDLLLCYGDFWANCIDIPNKKYVLGNPHLENSLEKVKGIKPLRRLLIIGSGVTINETNDLLQKLLSIMPQTYEAYYRPHPQEKDSVTKRYGKHLKNGLKIDQEELYLSMAKAEIIVGELTTAIFEAIALNKKIYLYNSSYTKTYYSNNIKYLEAFTLNDVETIFKGVNNKSMFEYYWKYGWKNCYRELGCSQLC